ncbi:MAG: hypothetical protein ABSB11_07635 [Sedimentisphaerales bacterium]
METVRIIGGSVAIIFGLWWGIHVARAILASGIESFSGRILLSAAIAGSVICAGATVFFCIIWAAQIYHGQHFLLIEFAPVFALLLFPLNSFLNYGLAPRRLIKEFNLQTCSGSDISRQIADLSGTLLIKSPLIMTSELIETPFVFGRSSMRACIAIPQKWEKQFTSASVPMLLHELAHIRNKDVGFLGWAFAFIGDSGFGIMGLLIILVLSSLSKIMTNPMESAYIVYIFSIVILRLIYVVVLKERELLADRTVAAVLAKEKLTKTIGEQDIMSIVSSNPVRPYDIQVIVTHLNTWLADKAYYGRYRRFWSVLYKCVDCFNPSHPSIQKRINSVKHAFDNANPLKTHFRDCLLAGLAIGMVVSFVFLAGVWFSRYVLQIEDDADFSSVRLSYNLLFMICPILVTFVLINVSLPIWASLRTIHLDRSYIRITVASYAVTFVGIICGCLLMIVNGVWERTTWFMIVLSIGWIFLNLVAAFILNVVITGGWVDIKHFSSRQTQELLWILQRLIVVPLVIFAVIITMGMLFIHWGRYELGSIIILSFVIGLIWTALLTAGSTFANIDRYIFMYVGRKEYKIEGMRCDTYGAIVMSAVFLVTSMTPAILIFTIMYTLLQWWNLHFAIYIWIGLLLLACIAYCFLYGHQNRRSSQKRHQLFLLFESCRLLNPSFAARRIVPLEQKLKLITMQCNPWRVLSKMAVRTNMLFELVSMAGNHEQLPWREDAIKFVSACEDEGGFALWPRGASRLSSTYQALATMKKTSVLPHYPADVHISWIQRLQQASGSFTDPVNLRPAYENTYFAIMALDLLGYQVSMPEMQRCRQWALSELRLNENSNGDISRIHHCSKVADMLGTIPHEIMEQLWQWTQQQLRISLLLNPVHDAESIFYVLNVNVLCRRYNPRYVDDAYKETIEILSKKLEAAFFAELKNVRL